MEYPEEVVVDVQAEAAVVAQGRIVTSAFLKALWEAIVRPDEIWKRFANINKENPSALPVFQAYVQKVSFHV